MRVASKAGAMRAASKAGALRAASKAGALRAASKAATGLLIAVVTLCAGCSAVTATAEPARVAPPVDRYQTAIIEHELAHSATDEYARLMASAAATFGADARVLADAVDSGDGALAEHDELTTQSALDAVGQVLEEAGPAAGAGNGPTAATTDDEVPAALHLVERDLWDGGNADDAATAVELQAPLVALTVSRVHLAPATIAGVGVDDLGWVDDEVVTGDQEAYSHLDAVDAVAGVAAAQTAFDTVGPLGHLVAQRETSAVIDQFALLDQRVDALGIPGTRTDGEIGHAPWLALAQQVDATAAALSALGGDLADVSNGESYR